ncbi:alternative cyclin Pho80 [Kwoniella mangroviensis CBS 10435]|uniref:Alternative cyclin Pho80 n=1 Tax=Kwoniella mangroviensis CBS 10435 TaxID=1331196 RepID=A0A1B9IWL9_9TREE|nr:alternative cyclin Pho80 [Kwoniella mangroviensis CBS 10435]
MSNSNANASSSSTSTSTEPIIGPPNPQNPPLLPWAFSDCPLDILVDLLTHMLELLIKHNDQVILTPDALTRFHSRAAPGISVKDYLGRIVKYTNLEKIPLLSLLAYIDTTCTNLPSFTLSSLTVHRFLIASICAGSKAQCDVFCTNAHYAKVGGIKTQELNALERELLRVTKWDLCCHAEQLQKYYTSLIRSHGGYAQSPQPANPPFLPFPRSRSKPRASTAPSPTPEGDTPAPPGQDGEPEPPDEDEAMGEGDDDEGMSDEDESSMVIDASPRGRKRIKKTSDNGGMMDVDTSPTTAQAQEIPIEHDESNTSNHSPISSASTGSSSVPSSSKSSIHRNTPGSGSLKGKRSRLVSISESKIAEPKIDTTPAVADPSPTSSTKLHAPPPQNDQPKLQPKTPAPIPTPTRKSTSAILTTSTGTSSDPKPQSHSHSHSSGKLLKSLVGGIFRRKSLPGDGNDLLAISPSSTSTNNGNGSLATSSAANANGKSKSQQSTTTSHSGSGPAYNVIPSKPIQSPTSTGKSGITASRPTSTSTTTSPRIYSSTSATGDKSPKPGLAKPVTPKVRTRDETSLDPRERVALGAPMGMGMGIAVDELEGKRSRIP